MEELKQKCWLDGVQVQSQWVGWETRTWDVCVCVCVCVCVRARVCVYFVKTLSEYVCCSLRLRLKCLPASVCGSVCV